MKTYHKIGLITAGIFAAAGIGLCTAALIIGINSGELSADLKKLMDRKRGSKTETRTEEEVSFEDVSRLDIELGYADMEILEGESDKLRVVLTGSAQDIECRQNGETLMISDNREGLFSFLPIEENDVSIRMEIPKNAKFQETDIEVGTGELHAEFLDTGELSLDCGVGEIAFGGIIRKDADIDCGVGSISMNLAQSEKDFNYDIDCGVGDVRIGSQKFDGIGTERSIDNDAAWNMELDCGVGDIKITFEKE